MTCQIYNIGDRNSILHSEKITHAFFIDIYRVTNHLFATTRLLSMENVCKEKKPY